MKRQFVAACPDGVARGDVAGGAEDVESGDDGVAEVDGASALLLSLLEHPAATRAVRRTIALLVPSFGTAFPLNLRG